MPGLIVAIARTVAAGVLVAMVAGCAAGQADATQAPKPRAAHARTALLAAHARRPPGIYLGAMAGPWYGPSVRPSSLPLGADWSIDRLRWTHWSRRRADGRGYFVACQGADGPCDNFWVTIAASHVLRHDGRRYFALMKITGRHQRVEWLVMNTTVGWWQQSARP
ncbi:MAG TPA: hypothetical protein VEV63_08770 [Streptosporangiaceae bacterium]|nr:hypothetical protein [Streptosporangiaceae bacterium]